MPNEEERWLNLCHAEIERLFDGRLPKHFNIDNIPYTPRMKPEEAALDFFIGYCEHRVVRD